MLLCAHSRPFAGPYTMNHDVYHTLTCGFALNVMELEMG